MESMEIPERKSESLYNPQTKIYFAAPLFSEAEKDFNQSITDKLEELGLSVYLPQRDCEANGDPEKWKDPIMKQSIFNEDLEHLQGCDIIIAVIDGQDIDSGVAFEIGYCYSQMTGVVSPKTIMLLCTTERDRNLMITEAADYVFNSVEDLIRHFSVV